MKKMMILIIAGFMLGGCSHRIIRTGYEADKKNYQPCDVVIKTRVPVDDSLFVKVGTVELGETGFSTHCSEAEAIRILRGEACAVDADLIVITEERRPGFASSCYRCVADFYQFKMRELADLIEDDQKYDVKNTQSRVQADRSKNTGVIIGGFAIGFVIGLLLFQ